MSLDDIFHKIETQFGERSTLSIGEEITKIPTGIFAIDMSVGLQGLPTGKIIELYGKESAGKSLLMYSVIAAIQKKDGTVVLFDKEITIDINYVTGLGVQSDKLLVSNPSTGEETFDIIKELILSNEIDLIVLDSLASIVSEKEFDVVVSKNHTSHQKRLIKRTLKKLVGVMINSKTSIIFINQVRYTMGKYSKEIPACGGVLNSYASLRYHIKKLKYLKKDDEDYYGIRVKLSIIKNMVSKISIDSEFDMLFNSKFPLVNEVIDLSVKHNIISKSGPWYIYNGATICQGRDNFINHLKNNNSLYNELRNKIEEAVSNVCM